MNVVYRSDNCIIVDDFFDDLDTHDTNDFFRSDLGERKYEFPEMHDQFIIDQYNAVPVVKEYGDRSLELIRQLRDDVPTNVTISAGCHEIRHHTDGIGAIPPHSDRGHYCGISVFLNREWNKDWGGWNYTYQDEEIKINPPKYNRAVIIIAPVLHGCTPVWQKDKVRRTIQIFIDDKDAN